MSEPPIPELEALRDRLYAQLSAVGDFRRGSVSENYASAGSRTAPVPRRVIRGHGPRLL